MTASLCVDPSPSIPGLEALYEVLGFVGDGERLVATTTHSLGLSARSVSGVNPRTFVFVNNSHYQPPIPYEKLAAVAFARGEQFVEMVALDTATFDWNFYLLVFEQACNATRCTPEQLLTEKIERDWTRWTLYSDRDLVDTPLDCISCHLPFGPGTHKLLLMREISDPWLHWGDFRGVDESANCSQDGPVTEPRRHVPGEGLNVLLTLEGSSGRYGGVSVAALDAAKSGRDFADFLVDARSTITDSPYGLNFPYGQLEFDSARILCERLATGSSPTWEHYRSELVRLGLPVAYHGSDVLDAAKRIEVLADRAGFLARHEEEDGLAVARSLIGSDAASAAGFVPGEQDSAPEILQQMCVRCHANDTPRDLRRAGFNAESLDRVEPMTARVIRDRIHLPRNSPKLMPPLRTGELTASAVARIDAYLSEHCADARPGACD